MHTGHRRRMRVRLDKSGPDSFASHELLEMLLYDARLRVNTNELAHSLMERFGSLSRVITATKDELMTVKGIGENSASLINVVNAINQKCATESIISGETIDSVKKVTDFASKLFVGSVCETVYAIYLDNSLSLVDYNCVTTGSINEAKPIVRNIAEKAILKKAASVILVHNHPNSSCKPSINDIDFTTKAERGFETLGIYLIDHFVFGNDGCYSIKTDGYERLASKIKNK